MKCLKKYNLNPCLTLEMSDIRSMENAVVQGFGCAMLMSVPLCTDQLCYLSLDGIEQIEQQVELAYRSDITLTRPMKEMIRLLLEKGEEH